MIFPSFMYIDPLLISLSISFISYPQLFATICRPFGCNLGNSFWDRTRIMGDKVSNVWHLKWGNCISGFTPFTPWVLHVFIVCGANGDRFPLIDWSAYAVNLCLSQMRYCPPRVQFCMAFSSWKKLVITSRFWKLLVVLHARKFSWINHYLYREFELANPKNLWNPL